MTKFKIGNNDAVEFDLLEIHGILNDMQIFADTDESLYLFAQVFGLKYVTEDIGLLTFIITDPRKFLFAILKCSKVFVIN